MEPDPLTQLRDVILPPEPGLWPPAPGWWLLLVLAIIGMFGAIYLIRLTYWRLSEMPLADKIDALAGLHPQQAVVELSVLMRRIALTEFPRGSVAGLSGEAWLEFLDETGNTDQFTRGPGRALASAPYSDVTPDHIGPLFQTCRSWAQTVSD